MTEVVECEGIVACFGTCSFECFFGSFGSPLATFRKVVSRDAVTPPKLAADAPVLDIFEPVAIGVFVFSRVELDVVVHHWSECDFGKVLHFEEPLHREFWFDRHIGAL